ncbi:MAG: sulfatase-like hydrolase/transferase [Anaerolineae bacterium]|nr:sulfatase-like hydrolase/transferase [Anaerolineae bacterium]
MKAILVLSDSLNRHFLPSYGNDWVQAPNIERFARMSVTFDNHWIGSAPCMPARRDLITGRLNFLEREWGGLEPFDVPFPPLLQDHAAADGRGVFCHMETDHYHYFHVGGENYHMPFNSWNFHRGQEWDTYVSRVDRPPEPEHLGKWKDQYALNQTAFKSAADFSTPRTFQGAIDWLQANEGADNYFLWVEVFDPHEPFDCPPEYLDRYRDDWDGPLYNWSGYEKVDRESAATKHLRKQYAATLTMMDEWFGKLLDELKRQNAFDDTLIILTTDHGHLLGERGLTGKNAWQCWNELAHIPLIVHLPGDAHAGERRGQLTQNVDLMPTLLEYFGVPCTVPIHGEPWLPMLYENAPAKRQSALYGWFGQTVNVTDGVCTYFRAPVESNTPLYRYFLTPGSFSMRDVCHLSFYDGAELGHFLPWTPYPVIRADAYRRRSPDWAESMLYNLETDYAQTTNLAGTPQEAQYIDLLRKTMENMDAPPSQYVRLGLDK